MKTLATSALIALAGLLGAAAADANAVPAQQTAVIAHLGGDAHGKNFQNPENTDTVTNQGPNKTTPGLRDTLGTALGTLK